MEEDIVLSMNVKHLKVESCNEKWEAAYSGIILIYNVSKVSVYHIQKIYRHLYWIFVIDGDHGARQHFIHLWGFS